MSFSRAKLIEQIQKKQSCLCVGLDVDVDKLPTGFAASPDSILPFCREIIEATADHAVAYKPNTAFFEAYGSRGWAILEELNHFIKSNFPDHFLIADAKRGDIGNTSSRYAKAFFEQMPCDALTIAPYMGSDSIQPFMEFEGKWAIVLGLTSNAGGSDFQRLALATGGKALYQEVLEKVALWGHVENTMFVVGATQADALREIRRILPHHFLLVPGVGAQGGSVAEVMQHGSTGSEVGLLINASRSILYASGASDYAQAAQREAQKMREQMRSFIVG